MICPHCSSLEQNDSNYIGITRCGTCDRPFSIHHAKGRLALENGLIKEAIVDLEMASKHMRRTALVFVDLARAYHSANLHTMVRQSLERAFALDPELVVKQWLRDETLTDFTENDIGSIDALIHMATTIKKKRSKKAKK